MSIQEERFMTIEKIGVGEIRRLQQLARLCYLPAFRGIHTEEQNQFSFSEMYGDERLAELLVNPDYHFFIISDNGCDLGYLALCRRSSKTGSSIRYESLGWLLDKIYLRPEAKGRGYGRNLMDFAFDYIVSHSSSENCKGFPTVNEIIVRLHVNRRKEEVKFYKHMGFQIVEEWNIPIADGRWIMDGYTMERIIDISLHN